MERNAFIHLGRRTRLILKATTVYNIGKKSCLVLYNSKEEEKTEKDLLAKQQPDAKSAFIVNPNLFCLRFATLT